MDAAEEERAADPLFAAPDDNDDDERSALNPEHGREPHAPPPQPAVNVPQVVRRAEFRRPLAIVCFSMLCQQLSGVCLPACPQQRRSAPG